MTVAIVCLLAVLAIIAAAHLVLATAAATRRAPAIDGYVGHTVVLALLSGSSLRGVLVDVAPDALTLARAEHLGDRGAATPLDGRQLVERGRVDFFQVPLAGGERA